MDLITPFLRIFFNLIYHQLAWIYDFISWAVSGGRWNRWVLRAEQFIQGPHVLELGFGPGHLLIKMTQSGLDVVGMDVSRQMGALAKRKFIRNKMTAQLVSGQGEFPPFRAAYFNSVVATFPTAYILKPDTLENICRILAPGGCLVILLSSWIQDPSLYGHSLAWLYRVTGQVLPKQFDMQNLLSPFQKAGFDPRPEWVTLPGSRLLFIVALKKINP